MSEHQYYEFQAIDRRLDKAARQALRSISSRAEITATSFTNEYHWGDFKGDPREFMERWFDLHFYIANWGTRRLMMRVPSRFLSPSDLDPFIGKIEGVETWTSGDSLIIDIFDEVEEPEFEPEFEYEDGSGWLENIAPLRADVISGDLRMFHLLWLKEVQHELVDEDEREPLAGIGPLSHPLAALAKLLEIDPDLVEAAAESCPDLATPSEDEVRKAVEAIPEHEKTALLLRVVEGDAGVGHEIRVGFGRRRVEDGKPRRTAGALRRRAGEVRVARERAEAEHRAAEERRKVAEAEKARRARIAQLKKRGVTVWQEVEQEVERRNASGYDRAAGILSDLKVLAVEEGSHRDFDRRLAALRDRHGTKRKFIERLDRLEAGE